MMHHNLLLLVCQLVFLAFQMVKLTTSLQFFELSLLMSINCGLILVSAFQFSKVMYNNKLHCFKLVSQQVVFTEQLIILGMSQGNLMLHFSLNLTVILNLIGQYQHQTRPNTVVVLVTELYVAIRLILTLDLQTNEYIFIVAFWVVIFLHLSLIFETIRPSMRPFEQVIESELPTTKKSTAQRHMMKSSRILSVDDTHMLRRVTQITPKSTKSVFNDVVDQFPDGVLLLRVHEHFQMSYCNEAIRSYLDARSDDEVLDKLRRLRSLRVSKQRQMKFPLMQKSVNQDSQFKELSMLQKCKRGSHTLISQIPEVPHTPFRKSSEGGKVHNVLDRELRSLSKQLQRQDFLDFLKKSSQTFHLTSLLNGSCEQPDGNILNLEIKMYLGFFGNCPQIMMVVSNVSFRDEIQQLIEQNEAKSNQLSYVSHEFRTPLNCIITMLEYCLEEGSHEGTPPKNYHTDHKRPNIQYLRIALENCRYLLNLSNDLLDLAQIKIGQFKLAKQTFNLKGLLKECISMFTLMATKKSIQLELEYSTEIPQQIFQDRNRIKQVIVNLLGNAFKFTLQGEIRIIVRYDGLMCISIKDSGTGIRKEDQSTLFKAFGKGDNIENKKYNKNGVGLGLLISNMLAQQLSESGQGLQFESLYGVGTTVSLILQIHKQDEDNSYSSLQHLENNLSIRILPSQEELDYIAEQEEKPQEVKVSETKRTRTIIPRFTAHLHNLVLQRTSDVCKCSQILIVDDDQFNIDALILRLLKQQYDFIDAPRKVVSVDFTISGLLALQKVQHKLSSNCCKYYKIIFLDIEMPYLDGFDTYRQIRNVIPGQQMPFAVVACSGYTSDREKSKCAQIGMDSYLEKPIVNSALVEILHKFL